MLSSRIIPGADPEADFAIQEGLSLLASVGLTIQAPEVCSVLSIDAWRDGDGWTWNAWYRVGDVPLEVCGLSARRILRWMRAEGYLGPKSTGKVAIEDDGYNVVIVNRSTGEPLFALAYGEAE